ncbi:hypothetical protein E2C01_026569 [Portunus trituberculatus]|uniref:Uncharacterized protein n=1 Tax=Portunus trituberculatus TaxID=210409 RepID=A0A5B7EJ50_PORTR|nr:hypothetical protein [Portunus trituberculatus]
MYRDTHWLGPRGGWRTLGLVIWGRLDRSRNWLGPGTGRYTLGLVLAGLMSRGEPGRAPSVLQIGPGCSGMYVVALPGWSRKVRDDELAVFYCQKPPGRTGVFRGSV